MDAAEPPVAAPDHAETIKHGRAHVEFLGMYVDTEQAVEELEAVCDLADALLAERQQDKERIERLETALSVYADPRHWAISRDDLAMRVVSWIDRLLCRVFGHCYVAYRIPIRCMYCGQRWRARGSHD